MMATTLPTFSTAAFRIRTAAQWAAMLGVALATMEFSARLDDHFQYGAPIAGNYGFDRLFSFDGKIVRGIPDARYMKWSLNRLGLRGPDPDLSRPHTRVLVYGASEVFGLYETPGHDFPRRLESELRGRAPELAVEVINAGIPGMRIGSGAEYLRSLGEELKPAIVLLYPTPTHYTGVTRPHCGRAERIPRNVIDSSAPSSRLLAKTIDRLKEVLPRPLLHQARRAAIAWATRGQQITTKVDPASLAALEGDLQCAIQAVRAIGAIPVLLTHANRFGTPTKPDDDYWLTGWRNQYPEYSERMLLELEQRANIVVEKTAQTQAVALVESSSALSGHPELFADHAHFNDQGSAYLGKVLAGALTPMLSKP